MEETEEKRNKIEYEARPINHYELWRHVTDKSDGRVYHGRMGTAASLDEAEKFILAMKLQDEVFE